LKQLDSTYSNSATVPNSLTSKETHFLEKLKISYKWTYMCDERKDFNT